MSGRLAVGEPDEIVTVEGQAGQAGEGAFAVARVVEEPLALVCPARGPYRQLVRDDHGFMAARCLARIIDGGLHTGGDVFVGLAPRRLERIAQLPPVLRAFEGAVADAERLALELVARLDDPGVGVDRHLEDHRQRFGGLLSSLERRGDEVHDLVLGQPVGGSGSHLVSELGQEVLGKSPVEHTVGVVDLAVAHQVHDRAFSHVVLFILGAPARRLAQRRGAPRQF